MEFTNHNKLPDFVHKGLTFSNYNRDGIVFDISATKLIDSPQIAEFWRSHGKMVTEDSSDRVWSAFGTAVHSVFEDANKANANVLMEKRFLWEYDGKVVAAQIDAYEHDTGALYDIKTCAAFKLIKGDNKQWERQLNVGATLMRRNGYKVNSVNIVAIIKDWSKMKSDQDPQYPSSPIVVVPMKLWHEDEGDLYIKNRLKEHFGDGPKSCTDEDRWMRPGSFAVMKKGRKRAARLLNTREEAEAWIADKKNVDNPDDMYIDERPVEYTRCKSFCPFKEWCTQYDPTNTSEIRTFSS